jgi:ElaB/YqjD/DUF883 family membrane-anchored ribosome-binding protein
MVNVNKPVAGAKQARTVPRDHQKSGRTVRETAQEKVERLHAGAADCAREGQDQVQQVERSFAQYVREHPLKSILIAAGAGLVFGRFWLRR